MLKAIEEKTCGRHMLETGSMYTLLRRMERRGLLVSKWERSETEGPDRRVYKVTKAGKEALRSGLESIAGRKNLMDDLAEFYKKNFESRKRR